MIHDRLLGGQFMLDLKPEYSTLLQATTTTNNHLNLHQLPVTPMALHATQLHSPSTPIGSIDLYSVYAYQQQQQKQQQQQYAQVTTGPSHHHSTEILQTEEALDLSRARSDYSEPRTTPSPFQDSTDSLRISPSTVTSQERTTPVKTNSINKASHNTFEQNEPQFSKVTNMPTVYSNLYHSETFNNTDSLKQIVHDQASYADINVELLNNIDTTSMVGNAVQEPGATPPLLTAKYCPISPINNNTINPLTVIDQKNTRPFKAYPRDPLVIAATFAATDVLMDNPRVERYTEYRKRVLEQIRNNNGGFHTICNPKMRRTSTRCISTSEVDTSSIASETDERLPTEESSDGDSNIERNNNNSSDFTSIGTKQRSTNLKETPSAINTAIHVDKSSSIKETNINEMDQHHQKSGCNNNSTPVDLINIQNHSSSNGTSTIVKDAAYYERRRKNNVAAKKSRDRRRIKEDEIAIRAAYLERQNIELLCQIDALKAQLAAYSNKIAV